MTPSAMQGRLRERESPFPMIPVDEAIGEVLKQATPLEAVTLSLADIPLGSVLAVDVTAPEPLPPFPASTMDGYAVVASDGEAVLEVVGRITAGVDPDSIQVSSGQCAYITTGAKLPQGADAVVKVEDTAAVDGEDPTTFSAEETSVRILKGVRAAQSVRPVGHDITEGATVLRAGEVIQAAEIGLLATVGVADAPVIPRPRVGVMSTGDELVEPGEKICGGFIRDSNRATLLAAVASMGGVPVDLGIVKDKEATLKGAVEAALEQCDVLVTSGGVSMGEADLLKPILESLGTVHFGRIRMKPGKPTTFATTSGGGGDDGGGGPARPRLVFALPGNPASSLVCSHLFVAPALRRMRGYALPDCMPAQVDARLTAPLRLDSVRPEYHRAVVSWNNIAGRFDAASTGNQMSCRLLSMKSANALLCVPRGEGELAAGQQLPAILIGELPPPSGVSCFHAKAVALATGKTPSPVSPLAAAGENGPGGGGGGGPTGYVSFPPSPPAERKKGGAVNCCGKRRGGGIAAGATWRLWKCVLPRAQQSWTHAREGVRTHVNACLLTVSDRASQGVYEDLSGPAMRQVLENKAAVKKWCDDSSIDLVLTSGGTGFGRRDLTPEAIRPLLHREAPGVVHAIYQGGLKFTPLAVLSRPVAGTRNNTLVVTLPGSVKAVKENLGSMVPLLPRIVNLLKGNPC
ncbi:conserved unknown protein [Ectocarpus siliculosus]|uniref:MoaB/Mog domain-containing protein n=1 Tax=Ectocarpus siliculosus TaxID=2880 RepID=D8LBK7_ECTSI|nr:conserved unknown protein [Ectocarpus siliculosus]|eukprot:CBN76716.1 conserved unknown protein [Ectocarpus siliculosus]